MFKAINGFTRASMKAKIRAGNNGKAAYEFGTCLYLTDDGNRCAVGCFIPDGHPGQKIVGAACTLVDRFPDLLQHLPLSPRAASLMQAVHDRHSIDEGDVRDALDAWIDANVLNPGEDGYADAT